MYGVRSTPGSPGIHPRGAAPSGGRVGGRVRVAALPQQPFPWPWQSVPFSSVTSLCLGSLAARVSLHLFIWTRNKSEKGNPNFHRKNETSGG